MNGLASGQYLLYSREFNSPLSRYCHVTYQSIQRLSLSLLLSMALLPASGVFAADVADEVEQAMLLGEDIQDAEASQRLNSELEAELRRHAPEQLARFESLGQNDRLEVLEVYRDSGYIPAVVQAMGGMRGPAD